MHTKFSLKRWAPKWPTPNLHECETVNAHLFSSSRSKLALSVLDNLNTQGDMNMIQSIQSTSVASSGDSSR